MSNQVSISFTGDILLAAEVESFMGKASVRDWLAGVSTSWRSSDLLIGNLECPCVVNAESKPSPVPEIVFRGNASRVQELADSRFSMVTLGNNHILDCGRLGLKETIAALNDANLGYTGAGLNLEDALQPAILTAGELRFAVVSFCYGPPADHSTPGVVQWTRKLMQKGLSLARSKGDLVIAVLHDGIEYSDVPPSKVRRRFRFLAERGADLVIGHHPHVLQGMEWWGGVPIFYSLGDLLFHNSLKHVSERNFKRIGMGLYAPEQIRRDPFKFGRGAILKVLFAGGKVSGFEWFPFHQDEYLRPQLSTGEMRLRDQLRLERLNSLLGDEAAQENADYVLERAWWADRDSLSIRELFRMAKRPKWAYLPRGFEWLWRKVTH